MDRVLKSALLAYLADEMPRAAPGFAARTLKPQERAQYAIAPIAFFSRRNGDQEQFIAFVPVKGGSSSRFLVECGWLREPPVPVATAESAGLVRSPAFAAQPAPPAFATRLFWLCQDRGNGEQFWNLFSPEVWDPGKEAFRDFASRQTFAATDEALRVYQAGGITPAYADAQARLVGGDCLGCIRTWAVPFLDRQAGQVQVTP